MSTINVRSCRGIASAVGYVLYGAGRAGRERAESGATRASAFTIHTSSGTSDPAEFVQAAQAHALGSGRKVEAYTYVLAFSPEEFDVNSPEHVERVRDIAVKLTKRMHTADYLVAVHTDAKGQHVHAHIVVANHDNLTGKCLTRYTSWTHGLHQLNDELMDELGLQVLPEPTRPKPDWDLRRNDFAPGGFEQSLGDIVAEALRDPRCTNREAFEALLAKDGVRLAVTDRDGWSFKMRRESGKWGRKKASALSHEFTADEAEQIFNHHATRQAKQTQQTTKENTNHGNLGRPEPAGRDGGLHVQARKPRDQQRPAASSSANPGGQREGDGRGPESSVDLAAVRASLAASRRLDEARAKRAEEDARRALEYDRWLAALRAGQRSDSDASGLASPSTGSAAPGSSGQAESGYDGPDF
ncbi:relaxase/mobilization nuclease domain-containing protein [Actinomyces sp. 565]|uniref:relaxase/mobilization nuclease domain-containing protein n=1 Tax=Actinomyces sp. 565 TaxID=2057794 RepID=UPI0013A6C3AA|nr:relaxase/mobilization nuclease domain-containing protein [Actinomyces sp. 565]NDR52721.1 relaxase/mobilization nuclease domain-containing protein [Actinomyces sp. 565]